MVWNPGMLLCSALRREMCWGIEVEQQNKWKQEFLQVYSWVTCVCRFVVGSKVTLCKYFYSYNPSKIH